MFPFKLRKPKSKTVRFLWATCIAIGLFLLSAYAPFALQTTSAQSGLQPIAPPEQIRGVWLTNVASGIFFVPWGIKRSLQQLAQLNFNTIYPVVWNRGYTLYPSAIAAPLTGKKQMPWLGLMHLGQDVLAQTINQAHQYGLRVLPWFEYGFIVPTVSQIAQQHPEWLTHTLAESQQQQGNRHVQAALVAADFPEAVDQPLIPQSWLNPFHPQVQEFMLNLILEVVNNYDIDGIQFDDHFSLPVAYGYDSYTIELYQQEHQGQLPPEDASDEQWVSWRSQKISEFMQRIATAVREVKPELIISLSPNSYNFAYKYHLQDWLTWVESGWVDELILQVYRSDLASFSAELGQSALQTARQRIPVAIGILTGTLGKPIAIEQVQQQVQTVQDLQFNGISFFYWETMWGYFTPESPYQRREGFAQLF
ncbi:protein of unknown function DUF187 [Thalassoporum mexicanum PCC 7367]|uniref:glycoside hydrolase family 10 protein n=1 Tax=Thalassoporum mexicanum TaxID=3457544 RepID=UPI00029FAFA3|nr:family 10 glycosylhydrolase [Pseudanabaena sp. PCC 7367]AFY70970.1 protein of unknown function DUF187 [Pseudanabaena sp. PCC 7367]